MRSLGLPGSYAGHNTLCWQLLAASVSGGGRAAARTTAAVALLRVKAFFGVGCRVAVATLLQAPLRRAARAPGRHLTWPPRLFRACLSRPARCVLGRAGHGREGERFEAWPGGPPASCRSAQA